ncbi:hypothetical protein [Corynebacterium sp. HMSC29G08]|uniref:hypothetical protein n=1 Tax=Corynebacterium sp. HMSC29G08 TaxID=1581069 RepID=UPI0008A37FF7|nr:hypothetical protein [Corynebacterium sp. HMSC29G08]OFT81574.1 hypothetical protein HMPREF3101_09820 [Corynebacterium sp. HMSC29G08]
MNQRSSTPIAVAVDDPLLHPEAIHIAAATGRPIIEVPDAAQLARIQQRAFAVLTDATCTPTPNTFHITHDLDPSTPRTFALPLQAAELLKALGALLRQRTPNASRSGKVIALVGACGGVGVSTLGASISKKAPGATLVDGHAHSGGLDLLLGLEDVPGARWGEVAFGDGAIARADVRRALPISSDDVAVLTFPRSMLANAASPQPNDIDAVASALGSAGVTVLDVPVEMVPQRCDLALVVVPGQLRPAASAARIVAQLAEKSVPHGLVFRRHGWESLSAAEVERIANSNVVAELADCRGLTKTVERAGLPARLPRPLARAVEAVLAEVGGVR